MAALKAAGISHEQVEWYEFDVAEYGKHADFVTQVKRASGGELAVVVNNAGIFGEGWSEGTYKQVCTVNAWGPARFLAQLHDQVNIGQVVVVSSGMGNLVGLSDEYKRAVTSASTLADLEAIPFQPSDSMVDSGKSASYRVSKAMVNRAVQLLADKWGGSPRINAICPGWVRTDMGGSSATRSVDEGSASVIATVNDPAQPNGSFFRDGKPIEW